jgi:hypothetical protein
MDKKLWEALVDGVVEVTFTKKDGSIRTMNCTLHKAWLPGEVNESMEPTGEHTSVWIMAGVHSRMNRYKRGAKWNETYDYVHYGIYSKESEKNTRSLVAQMNR